MRKQQKEQAEEVVRLVGQIHEGIKRAIEGKRYGKAMGYLAKCQESAIQL